MGQKLKIRVNPDDHKQVVVDTKDGTDTPWVDVAQLGAWWRTDSHSIDWDEFELDIPVPKRLFKPGDVVNTNEIGSVVRAVRFHDVWYSSPGDRFLGSDKRIEERGFTYVGNIANMESAK